MGELKKVLCIEDEADIRKVAELSLQTVGGFDVFMCSSGKDALENAESFAPDLILLDVMMPQMDGPTTLKNLLQIESLKSVPVIFMTAKVQKHEKEHYLSLGALGVIPKPFDPMKLPTQVKEIWKDFQPK